MVADTPGIVGYGGKVTVGSAVVVDAVDMAIIRAAGADVDPALFDSVGVVTLRVSAVSGAGVAVCSVPVTVVECVCLPSVSDAVSVVSGVSGVSGVSVVGVVVFEGVSVGIGFSVVGSVDVVSFDTLVPEPPEALTDEVGPSPEVVVVVVCELDVVVDVVDSVSVVVLVAAPEVVVPEALALLGSVFDPVSEFAEGSDWPSSVVADATPCPVATAIPSPTANANPLARLARFERFACLPRLADAIARSRTPPSNGHGPRRPGRAAN